MASIAVTSDSTSSLQSRDTTNTSISKTKSGDLPGIVTSSNDDLGQRANSIEIAPVVEHKLPVVLVCHLARVPQAPITHKLVPLFDVHMLTRMCCVNKFWKTLLASDDIWSSFQKRDHIL